MQLEIIIPAHNEQHRISDTLDAYSAAFDNRDVSFVVAMDDCTDSTAELVTKHQTADPRVRATDYPRLGKGGVLAEAFRNSQADYVAFVDADGATPPSELRRLVDICQNLDSDLAIASRYHPASVLPARRSRLRRLTARSFAFAVRHLFGLPYADTQCGAKVLRRSAAQRLTPLLSTRDFVFDVDLLFTARQLGLSVAEVPTVWLDRQGSRMSTSRDSARMAASLALLWLRNRIVPVQLPSAQVVALPDHGSERAAAQATRRTLTDVRRESRTQRRWHRVA
ncbi:MAG TPA: glycosyltransferase [Jatrophihabitans sp.]|jgi:glycosyltransferase involved in cell wall biosynthesis